MTCAKSTSRPAQLAATRPLGGSDERCASRCRSKELSRIHLKHGANPPAHTQARENGSVAALLPSLQAVESLGKGRWQTAGLPEVRKIVSAWVTRDRRVFVHQCQYLYIRCQCTRDVMTAYFELRVSPGHAQEMAAMARPQWSASNTIDFFRTLVRGSRAFVCCACSQRGFVIAV